MEWSKTMRAAMSSRDNISKTAKTAEGAARNANKLKPDSGRSSVRPAHAYAILASVFYLSEASRLKIAFLIQPSALPVRLTFVTPTLGQEQEDESDGAGD
jgi:hypothetical protein